MSHTEGKLNADGALIKNENGEMVAATTMIASDEGSPSAHEENARRLVACWNACEGLATEALELMPNTMNQVFSIANPKQERDELLEALKNCVGPLMLYQSYGWSDRNGLIKETQAILSRYQAESKEKN